MITDRFIFINVPGTGSYAVEAMIRARKNRWKIYHEQDYLTLKQAKDFLNSKELRNNMPSFCFVRNPWEWYVYRFFQSQRSYVGLPGSDFLKQFSHSRDGFTRHMYFLQYGVMSGGKMTGIGESVPTIWKSLTLNELHKNLTLPGIDHVVHFRNYARNFNELMSSLAPDLFVPRRVRAAVRQMLKQEDLAKGYHTYYDDDTRRFVEEWDKDYIEKFGFNFGD